MSSCSAAGRAVVAVLHPSSRSKSSRSKSSTPCTVFFSLQALRCFQKTPRNLGSRPKLLLFYHLSYWQEKEEIEGAIFTSTTFAGHEKAKTWWERPSGGEGRSGGLR